MYVCICPSIHMWSLKKQKEEELASQAAFGGRTGPRGWPAQRPGGCDSKASHLPLLCLPLPPAGPQGSTSHPSPLTQLLGPRRPPGRGGVGAAGGGGDADGVERGPGDTRKRGPPERPGRRAAAQTFPTFPQHRTRRPARVPVPAPRTDSERETEGPVPESNRLPVNSRLRGAQAPGGSGRPARVSVGKRPKGREGHRDFSEVTCVLAWINLQGHPKCNKVRQI